MKSRNNILELIYNTIDEINMMLLGNEKLNKGEHECLLPGDQSVITSLAFINFIVMMEQKIEKEYGTYVGLGDVALLGEQNNPFSSISELSEYIHKRIVLDS